MKLDLRRSLLSKRRVLSSSEVMEKSNLICSSLQSLSEFKSAKSILFYHPIDNEVSLILLVKFCLSWGKKILFPRVVEDSIEMCSVSNLSELESGKFGVLEPKGGSESSVDLIFVPGIGFDSKGGRIGYGKGYYDRFLNNREVLKVGVGYDFQVVENCYSEEHDVALDMIVTESKVLKCK